MIVFIIVEVMYGNFRMVVYINENHLIISAQDFFRKIMSFLSETTNW